MSFYRTCVRIFLNHVSQTHTYFFISLFKYENQGVLCSMLCSDRQSNPTGTKLGQDGCQLDSWDGVHRQIILMLNGTTDWVQRSLNFSSTISYPALYLVVDDTFLHPNWSFPHKQLLSQNTVSLCSYLHSIHGPHYLTCHCELHFSHPSDILPPTSFC